MMNRRRYGPNACFLVLTLAANGTFFRNFTKLFRLRTKWGIRTYLQPDLSRDSKIYLTRARSKGSVSPLRECLELETQRIDRDTHHEEGFREGGGKFRGDRVLEARIAACALRRMRPRLKECTSKSIESRYPNLCDCHLRMMMRSAIGASAHDPQPLRIA